MLNRVATSRRSLRLVFERGPISCRPLSSTGDVLCTFGSVATLKTNTVEQPHTLVFVARRLQLNMILQTSILEGNNGFESAVCRHRTLASGLSPDVWIQVKQLWPDRTEQIQIGASSIHRSLALAYLCLSTRSSGFTSFMPASN